MTIFRENDKIFIFLITFFSVLSTLTSTSKAEAAQFSFESGEGTFWDHSAVGGANNNDGWQVGQTTGTATIDGITLTVEATIETDPNPAQPSDNNLKIQTTGNTQGFVLGNINNSDDSNSGSLTNYQRVDFTFDKLVEFTTFQFADIDTDEETSIDLFVDALGVEGFQTNPGTIGTGITPNFDLTGSQLSVETIGGVNYVNRDIATYGKDNVSSNSAFGRAGVSFGSGVNVASLYFFNNLNPTDSSRSSDNHSINLYNASITVEQVPFEFYPSLGLFLSGGSVLGIKLFKKGQITKFNSEKK